MSSRGLSTALDVSLCLLLVSAAVITLGTVTPTGPDPSSSPTEVLAVLGAVTNTTATDDRGTPIERLAAGAIAMGRGDPGRAREHTRSVAALLNRTPGSAQVVVRWEPVTGLHIAGEVDIGEEPPPTAAVDAVRVVIPIGGWLDTRGGSLADTADREARALLVARAIHARLDPPCDTVQAVQAGRCPIPTEMTLRADELASTIESILEHSDEQPAPRDLLSVGRIVVIVRTWAT